MDEQDRWTLARAQRILSWLADGRPEEDFTRRELATLEAFDELVVRLAPEEFRAVGNEDDEEEDGEEE